MECTTSSSLYEARLGHEKFGGEVHAYSVAFSSDEIVELKQYANKIILNSLSQLERFHEEVTGLNIGRILKNMHLCWMLSPIPMLTCCIKLSG